MMLFSARMRLVVVLTPLAYSLVTLLLYIWQPLMSGWPIWQITAIIVPQMVLGMVFLVTPAAQHLIRRLS